MDVCCIVTLLIYFTVTDYFEKSKGVFAGPSNWTSASLKFIQATELQFCGTKTKLCNHYNVSELTDLYNEVKRNFPVLTPQENWTRNDKCCVGKCSCNLSECVQYGTCCTDIINEEILYSEEYGRQVCSTAQLRPRDGSVQMGQMIWMIPHCAKSFRSFTEESVIDKCEHPENYNTLDVLVPVSDLFTNLTYRNVYCLRCNGASVDDVLHWTANLECAKVEEGKFIQGFNQRIFIKEIWKTKTCNLIYNVPAGSTFRPHFCSQDLYTSCNITGKWKVYNAFIELACQTYISTYSLSYRNIFCYLCNEDHLPDSCAGGIIPRVFPLFSTLLKYNPDDYQDDVRSTTENTALCERSQVFDTVQNVCRNISCRFPKKEQDGQCVNMAETVAGMKLMIYLAFSPEDIILESDLLNIASPLVTYVSDKMLSWGFVSSLYSYTSLYKATRRDMTDFLDVATFGRPVTSELPKEPTNVGCEKDSSSVESDPGFLLPPAKEPASFDAQRTTSVGQSENNMRAPHTATMLERDTSVSVLDYFLFRIGIFIPTKSNHLNVTLFDEILKEDGKIVLIINKLNEKRTFIQTFLDLSLVDFTSEQEVSVSDSEDGSYLVKVSVCTPDLVQDPDKNTDPIIVTHSLTCPLVHIGTIDNSTVIRGNRGIVIYGKEINPKFSYISKVNGTETEVFVCINAFEEALESFTKSSARKKKMETLPSVKEIFSLVCVCISVICALVTLASYSFFKELRTQPGLNNMGLVINLIIAQVLFQFGINQAELIPSWACKTIGLLVHFFWLNVIFWMNVCSLHMFKSFTSVRHLKPRDREHKLKTTVLYSLYSTILSTLLVSINVTIANVLSDGTDFGYGGLVCYISSLDRMGYTFGIPVLAVVIINICLFIIVVIKISRTPDITSSNISERNYLAIYTKLASVTGVTWISGFVFYFTDIEVFEYIFILLNAGQGVLIFVAFVCNKRMLGMYCRMFSRMNKYRQSDTSPLQTKHTSLNSTAVANKV